jgi:hypothetical protein
MINFLEIIHWPNFYLRQCFVDWTLPLSSDKNPTHLSPVNRASLYFQPPRSNTCQYIKQVYQKRSAGVMIQGKWVKPGKHATESELHTWYLSMNTCQFSLKKLQASSLPFLVMATETMTKTVFWDRTSSCNAMIYSLRHCSEYMYLQHLWFIYSTFWNIHCSHHLPFKCTVHFHLTKLATFITFYFHVHVIWESTANHEKEISLKFSTDLQIFSTPEYTTVPKCLSICMYVSLARA